MIVGRVAEDASHMKVVLTSRNAPDGSVYGPLTHGRIYEVLGIEADWLRLLNDRDEPILYDPSCFQMIDPVEPANWLSQIDDGNRYAYPLEWSRPGFFEDWHDGVLAVRAEFMHQLCSWHPETFAKRVRKTSD